MKFSNLIVGIVLFSLVCSGLGIVWIDNSNKYGYTVDNQKYIETYNYLNETKAFSEESQTQVEGSDVDLDASDFAIVKDSIAVVKTSYRSITWIKKMADALVQEIHIPINFKTAAIVITISGLTLFILSAIFKWEL